MRVDSEPDIFYFSIPGANGRFLFSVKDNGDIVPVLIDKEKANVKIEVLLNSCSFEIYDEGGNKYEFSSQEHTRTFYRSGPCSKEGDDEIIAGVCDYGEEIVSSLSQNNLFSTQFHPEKSGKVGLKILKNFTNLEI